MNAQTILAAVLMLIVIIVIDYRKRHPKQHREPEQVLFDSARLQREIAALYHDSQELESLDQMIIDLRLCKPDELHKAFRIEWQGSTKSHSLDFMSTGCNANTVNMIALAEDQRAELNANIQRRIFDLYSRAQEMDFRTQCRYTIGEQNGETGDRQ